MIVQNIQAIAGAAPALPGAETTPSVAGEGGSFGEALGKIAANAAEALKVGEATAVAGLTGAASPLSVVNAVVGAQHTLQAALAIRDKAVSAYQEISRMAI